MPSYATTIGVVLLAVTFGQATDEREEHVKCHQQMTVSVDDCCKIPHLAEKSIVDKCISEHPFKPNWKTLKGTDRHPGVCIAQCILTGMGAYSNGKLDEAAFTKVVAPVVKGDTGFANLLNQTVHDCSAMVTFDSGFDRTVKECDGMPKEFLNCVYSTMFKKCPTTAWTERKECALLKDKLDQGCPYFALRKHGHRKNRH